jgi:hypothetical protein
MRSTLVAPGLFEPSLRGSLKPIILLSRIADEIEPSKYEKLSSAKISIMAGLEIAVLELYQISPELTARRHSALRWNGLSSILLSSALE